MSPDFPPNEHNLSLTLQSPPIPSHRHAGPPAPWLWIDVNDPIDPQVFSSEPLPISIPSEPNPNTTSRCNHSTCKKFGFFGCWKDYPQSCFPNWSRLQQERSGIAAVISNHDALRSGPCRIYRIDLDDLGRFTNVAEDEFEAGGPEDSWNGILHSERLDALRVRALFLENLSGPILQMLGTQYNIEPSFWSSSLNWIPTFHQEIPTSGQGDHITISLTFLKLLPSKSLTLRSSDSDGSIFPPDNMTFDKKFDSRAPLTLRSSNQVLALDLLSVNLIRSTEGNTLISYHSAIEGYPTTKASYLRDRIRYTGHCVPHWRTNFEKSPDPTFILLILMWHVYYAWDEALEHLYQHICRLKADIMRSSNLLLLEELHVIHVRHLQYTPLLEDLRKTITFLINTPNPALDALPESEQVSNRELLAKECNTLIYKVSRLETSLKILDEDVKNTSNLALSSVNIHDSRRSIAISDASMKDNGVIAYLSILFLPASFVAGVFGMNVNNLVPGTNGTMEKFIVTSLALTVMTVWLMVAARANRLRPGRASLMRRLAWPIDFLMHRLHYPKKYTTYLLPLR